MVGLDDQGSPGALAGGEGVEVAAIALNSYYAGNVRMIVVMLRGG
jgi:hypothetical protein